MIPHIQTIIPITVYHKYIAYVFMYDCICATTDARKTKTDVCTYNYNVHIYICTHARMNRSNTLFQESQADPGDSMSNTMLPSICTYAHYSHPPNIEHPINGYKWSHVFA